LIVEHVAEFLKCVLMELQGIFSFVCVVAWCIIRLQLHSLQVPEVQGLKLLTASIV